MKKIEKYDFSNLKKVSKAIYIISKVLEIILIVTSSIIFLAGIACTFALKHVKLTDTSISLGEMKLIGYDVEKQMSSEIGTKIIETAKSFFENGSKPYVIPICIFLCVIGLVIIIFMLHYLYKLFKNIHECDTPFINDNVLIITKMIFTLLVYISVPTLISYIIEWIFDIPLLFNWGVVEILALLILFAARSIFEYGCHLESKK